MIKENVNQIPKFIVDENVGKLTKTLRMLGFDTTFFRGEDDSHMLRIASAENRIILTRDTHILERQAVTSGKVRAILIQSQFVPEQTRQIIETLNLSSAISPFTRCLEDNRILIRRSPAEVQGKVPPYVWQTLKEYVECPACGRIYWKGTHWQAMTMKLMNIIHIQEINNG
jgi:uncharacterized protein